MNKKIIFLFFGFLALISFSAFVVADDPLTALLKKLEDYTKKYPQEKVYLHLDKPYYAVGDNIWFKAYVIDGKTSAPSALSNILYVELINERDSITKQLKLPMESGITWGDFKLADTLADGNYRIRAYTQWMRNAGPDFFFDKTIKIGNAWANEVFTKTTNVLSTEGNTDKVSSTIQFTDKQGKPYANTQVIYEALISNKIVARGKETTNGNGEVVIHINNNQAGKSGKIIASIMVDKQKIVKSIPIKTTSNAVDVQFFPEGGTLVEGLPSKIGIKAVNAIGLGENIRGQIIDNDGSEVLTFETSHLGMGSLFLSPVVGKTYSAKIKFANGGEKTVPLPKVEKSGYALSINNNDSAKVAVKVMLTADLLNKGELKLVAQHNGGVYFSSTIPTTKQIALLSMPKKEFISGITQFTLFNADNVPISERIIFITNNSDQIKLDAQNLQTSYSKRGKVDLNLTATNNNKPLQGSFSVAVTNTTAVTPDLENESNILTRLLLTADLVGYVEKPNYYFLNNDSKTQTALDNLMLTQGWRKINWKLINDNQMPFLAYQPEKTMKISGKITKGGKPVANGKVTLFSTSGGFFTTDTLSNAKGEFSFDEISFRDSTRFVVQARTDKNNKNVQIDLDIVPGQVVTPNKNTGDVEINVNEVLMPYLNQSNSYFDEQYKMGLMNRTIMLKEIKVVEQKVSAPNSQNLNGAGNADAVITAKDLQNSFSLSQYLSGRLAGISVRGGKAYSGRTGGTMSVVLDGITMSNDFLLDDIVVQDIESVEVLKNIGNTAIYGSTGANGVLVITTKRGGGTSNYNRYAPGIVTYAPKGFYVNREFYSPKYDANPDLKPDLRTTVYWNPHLVSDIEGKTTLTYYNTDQPGTYRIVIEGIDAAGNLARKVLTYQVN